MRGNRCSVRNAARNCKTTRNSALHAERASPTRTPPARKPPHVRPILRKRLPCRQTQAPTWPPTPTRLKRPRTRIQPTTSHLLTPQRTLVPQATPPLARHRTKRSRAPSSKPLSAAADAFPSWCSWPWRWRLPPEPPTPPTAYTSTSSRPLSSRHKPSRPFRAATSKTRPPSPKKVTRTQRRPR